MTSSPETPSAVLACAWMAGSGGKPHVVAVEDAIRKARQQRDELLAGDEILRDLDANDTSDETYKRFHGEVQSQNATRPFDGATASHVLSCSSVTTITLGFQCRFAPRLGHVQ